MFFLVKILSYLFTAYNIMIFVRILCSWVPDLFQYKIVQFIAFCVDPYLNLFRKIIPPLGMIDISPIFAIIALNVLEGFLLMVLR